jgi:hypothetical protein
MGCKLVDQKKIHDINQQKKKEKVLKFDTVLIFSGTEFWKEVFEIFCGQSEKQPLPIFFFSFFKISKQFLKFPISIYVWKRKMMIWYKRSFHGIKKKTTTTTIQLILV